MSTILDALRRADAERQRDAVPGLGSQPLPGPALHPVPHRARRWWVGLLLLLILGAVSFFGATRWLGQRSTYSTSSTSSTSSTASVPSISTAPSASSSAPLSVPSSASASADPPSQGVDTPGPAPPTARAAPPQRQAAAPSAQRQAAAPPAQRPAAAPPPRLAELPESFRRELPPLAVSGVVYAAVASSRLALVNGQVMREGETLPSGVTLERVFPLSAVFSFRGQRFELMP